MRILSITPIPIIRQHNLPQHPSFGGISADLVRRIHTAKNNLTATDYMTRILTYYRPYSDIIAKHPNWLPGVLCEVLNLPVTVRQENIINQVETTTVGDGVIGAENQLIGPVAETRIHGVIRINNVPFATRKKYLAGGEVYRFLQEELLPMFGIQSGLISIELRIIPESDQSVLLGVGQCLTKNLIIH